MNGKQLWVQEKEGIPMFEDMHMWRDLENNKVYLTYGTETIEVPHVIVEAYRQLEEESFRRYYAMADRIEILTTENAKLREVVKNLLKVTPADVVGVVIDANTDHPNYFKFDKALQELGIEV